MTVQQYFPVDYQQQTILKIALGDAETGGGVVSEANPFGVDVFITKLILDITTKSSGASTLDGGVGATATTSADNLIDGADAGTATILTDNTVGGGTNGKGVVRWDSDKFLTVSKKTGDAAGLAGYAYVHVARI